MTSLATEVKVQTAFAAPPVAVTAVAVVEGLTLQDWVCIGTLIYLSLQSAYLLWKWFRDWSDEAEEDAAKKAAKPPVAP